MKFSREQLRLYAVTDRSLLAGRSLCEQVEAALRGGATMVQLREKELAKSDRAAFLREACELRELTRRFGVPLLIDDDIEIALASGADGVHVGQGDTEAGEARRLLGPDRILGVTAKTVRQARLAEAAGADYLGSGAVFGTFTKPDALSMTWDTLHAICMAVQIPVVAIGGINRSNIARLAGSGIAGAAVVSGLFAAEDVELAARELAEASERIIKYNRQEGS